MERQKIYVAGPYTAPTPRKVLANVQRAMDAGLYIHQLGHYPFVPHLTHYLEHYARRIHGKGLPWEAWLRMDQQWLAACDALFFLSPSPGALQELQFASAHGLVIYEHLQEIPVLGWPAHEEAATGEQAPVAAEG
jgi:hypothetical protein